METDPVSMITMRASGVVSIAFAKTGLVSLCTSVSEMFPPSDYDLIETLRLQPILALRVPQQLHHKGVTTPLTQKVTSSLSGGCSFGGNRVRIDGCRIWFYLYDRCRAPATPKRLNGSIVLANCCGSSKNVSRPSPSWRASVRSPFGKPIVTSNMRSN